MSSDGPIDIVFICDKNYVMPTVVAISSLKANSTSNVQYNVYVLAEDINKEDISLLKMLNGENIKLDIIKMNPNVVARYSDSNIPNTLHVSKAALFKFLIPDIFKKLDKILYLDGDVLILKDLKELYCTDISNFYAVVVKDMKPMISYRPNQCEKLNIKHSAYFNSGVMLLNLKRLRDDKIIPKIVDYREHGINYFMDQDALNVIFEEKVKYTSYIYNMILSDYKFYSFEEIKEYYQLKFTSKDELINSTVILHLSSKEKPWKYYDVDFSDLWEKYYYLSPYSKNKLNRISVSSNNNDNYQERLKRCEAELVNVRNSTSYKIGMFVTFLPRAILDYSDFIRKSRVKNALNGLYKGNDREKKIIVSLTSYPKRMDSVAQALNSLLRQTMKPDKIILYLSKVQFPNEVVPVHIKKFKKCGITIEFVDDDLKSHKKYFYSMQKYPDDIIITVDDDVYYNPKLIERLYKSYVRHPNCISASRVHKITFDSEGNVRPYNSWQKNYKIKLGQKSMRLIATGVGGVLYPPKSIPDVAFDVELIKKTCIDADDLWLKIMEVLNNKQVVLASLDDEIKYIEKSQENALWKNNVDNNGNDEQLNKILMSQQKDIILQRMIDDTAAESISCDYYNPKLDHKSIFRDLKECTSYVNLYIEDTIIIIVVKDTASTHWEKVDLFSKLNLKTPEYRYACSYIVDTSNNVKIYKSDETNCNCVYKYDDIEFDAYSCGYKEKKLSYVSITFNNKKSAYTFDQKENRGAYIMLFSKKKKKVVDWFRLDLHKDAKLSIKRN